MAKSRDGDRRLNGEVSPSDALALDPEQQKAAREYAGIKHRLFFVETGAALLLICGLLFGGWSVVLRGWAEGVADGPWLVAGLYTVVLGAGYVLLSLPLSYYASYILPHRYGLSTQSAGAWRLDTLKELALSGAFGLAGVELLMWLLRTFPTLWWLIMAGLAWLFMVAMAQLAPVLLMPLFYKVRPLEDPELVARLTRLAERAGAGVRGVYVIDMSSRTVAANAMLTGLGRTRRIILSDTMLSSSTPDEVEAVLAHELAHHVHNDMLKGLVAEAAILLAGMAAAALALDWGVTAFGFRGLGDVAALPLFAVVMLGIGLVVMPLSNFFTRRMERAADLYALRAGKAEAFRSVMLKLAAQNLSDAAPPAWVRILFYSHPTIAERVGMAEQWALNHNDADETT